MHGRCEILVAGKPVRKLQENEGWESVAGLIPERARRAMWSVLTLIKGLEARLLVLPPNEVIQIVTVIHRQD